MLNPCQVLVLYREGVVMNKDWAHTYRALSDETREALTTDEAAFHLGRKPDTLRYWSTTGKGPIKPLRVFGRLAWRTEDIRKLLEV